jgi:hypothetical protein
MMIVKKLEAFSLIFMDEGTVMIMAMMNCKRSGFSTNYLMRLASAFFLRWLSIEL